MASTPGWRSFAQAPSGSYHAMRASDSGVLTLGQKDGWRSFCPVQGDVVGLERADLAASHTQSRPVVLNAGIGDNDNSGCLRNAGRGDAVCSHHRFKARPSLRNGFNGASYSPRCAGLFGQPRSPARTARCDTVHVHCIPRSTSVTTRTPLFDEAGRRQIC